ncbi:MAG TPA: hypothetical protein VE973_00735 [Candidatus Limnocylindria bacterium]|nr:hypothetical protein [Candidatus Limnocylindria bacterium]
MTDFNKEGLGNPEAEREAQIVERAKSDALVYLEVMMRSKLFDETSGSKSTGEINLDVLDPISLKAYKELNINNNQERQLYLITLSLAVSPGAVDRKKKPKK